MSHGRVSYISEVDRSRDGVASGDGHKNNSDDDSWIYTGMKAHRLAEKALEDANIPKVVGDVIDSFLEQVDI